MNLPTNLEKISDIWKGGFSNVILCKNSFLNKLEAVKIVDIDIYNSVQMKNILFEPIVLEYLRKSDYIVKVYDANFLWLDKFMIRMEYLKNGSLDSKNIFNLQEFLKITEHVSYALEYAHNKNILHLDIKPWNILINDDFSYKLSDFWLSNIKDDKWKTKFKMLYNLHIPPEYIKYKSFATEQTDIYMFGITLYRLINWNINFLKQLKKWDVEDMIVKWKFPNRDFYLPHIPKKIKALINKTINIDLNKRFISIKEFRKAFNKIKINLFWSPLEKHWDIFRTECYDKKDVLIYRLDLTVQRNWLYSINFFKYKKSSTKFKSYCEKDLDIISAFNKINNICSKFV